MPDARQIGDSLAERGIQLQLGTMIYDPSDPMGKMFFNILATFAEFEVDLLWMRTREGMAIAKAKGKLKSRAPKLSKTRQAHLLKLHVAGEHTVVELAELFRPPRPGWRPWVIGPWMRRVPRSATRKRGVPCRGHELRAGPEAGTGVAR